MIGGYRSSDSDGASILTDLGELATVYNGQFRFVFTCPIAHTLLPPMGQHGIQSHGRLTLVRGYLVLARHHVTVNVLEEVVRDLKMPVPQLFRITPPFGVLACYLNRTRMRCILKLTSRLNGSKFSVMRNW